MATPRTQQNSNKSQQPPTRQQSRKPKPEPEVEEDEGFDGVEAADANDQDEQEDQVEEYADLVGGMNLADPNLRANDGARRDLPPGEYLVEITDAKRKASKANATPMIEVTFTVVEGEETGSEARAWYLIKDTEYWRGRMKALASASRVPMDQKGNFSVRGLIGRKLKIAAWTETQSDTNPSTGEPMTVVRTRIGKESALVSNGSAKRR